MKLNQLFGTSALCVVTSLFAASMANAQTAPTPPKSATSVQEVVVTARGRAEKLKQVPVSVQAFSTEKLAQENIINLSTLQTAAGFTFNSQGASFFGSGREFPTLVFRGMTSNYGGGLSDSGALFVDGIYISGGAASVTMADVSQVDVLKGPQNVYFGKNTFGGAVNLITSNPTEAYHAKASVGYSDKGSYDDTFSAEGAILPGLLTARVTGELFHQGPQYHDASGNPLGEQDTKGITIVLYATPTSDIWLRNRFHYSYDSDSQAADGYIGAPNQGTSCAGMVAIYFCNGIPSFGKLGAGVLGSAVIPQAFLTDVANKTPNGPGTYVPLLSKVPGEDHAGLVRDNLQESIQGGAKLPYDASLQFNVGYSQQESLDIASSDHTPQTFPEFETADPYLTRDFQADARFLSSPNEPLRVVIGANYFRSVYEDQYSSFFFGGPGGVNAPLNEYDESEAAYGSIDYDILSYLTASGELRYQRDSISSGPGFSANYDHALPRLILKYHPDADTNLYLSYSEGIQPPQLQTSYVQGDSYTRAYLSSLNGGTAYTKDPKIRVWEVGLKKSFLDDRLFVSVDYYNQFWDNALVTEYIFNPSGCSLTQSMGTSAACPLPGGGAATFYVAQEHIQGVEFDGTARITSNWTAHMAFNYTDAIRTEYNDQSWHAAFISNVVPSQNGKHADLVPEWQLTADSTYKDHLFGDYDWYVHGSVNYTGPEYVEAANIAQLSGYVRVNATAGITKGNLTFEAFVTNLLDDKNWDSAVRFPSPYPPYYFGEVGQGVIAQAPNPRDFGFKISGKF